MSRTDSQEMGQERRAGDRRKHRVYVFRDRRTGFDRRVETAGGGAGVVQSTLIGLRDRPVILLLLLGVVNVLNMADFSLTLNALEAGAAEANPIMRTMLGLGPVWAGIFKIAAILLATGILWIYRRYRLALKVAIGVAAVFTAVLVYHILGMTLLG